MRIVIDGRMLSWTGIGRYTHALLEGLEAIDRSNEYVVLMRQDDWTRWKPQESNFRRVECNIDPYSPAEQATLPRVLRDLAPDVVHFVTPNAAALYRGTKVVTIHDLTLLDFDTSRGSLPKRLAGKLKRYPFRRIFLMQLASATHIVTDTGYVRDQLIQRFQVDPAKVSAVWIAADSIHLAEAKEESVDGLSASDSLILYVGNYFPYKNVRLLIESLALVARSRPDVKLVLAGKAAEYKDDLLALAASLNVADRIVMPGFISDGQLKWLYQNSAMYVYPSLSEGFGLQGLEAMAQGLPVLSSTATCLPEVYGDAALYFDPHSAGDLAQKIADLLARPELATEMAARGYARLPMFSWRATAEATHQIYLEAVQ
ncbi:glycosyltransferase family 4 protein [Actinoplanes sp. KI2]|uniref:glycosyltransferase family 4 protein n=1 Tax=Actinoplanes sp. KI2 TaxID=2983315 RepID=UPI0021D5CD57|nr:glycosyltransferase family 1 protein [Actinoplanes sp. KI2]MCU7730403.1 glycosyltransferase family 4 protein [Actinoplanes sp. KI2]